jgi:hypothetical protein
MDLLDGLGNITKKGKDINPSPFQVAETNQGAFSLTWFFSLPDFQEPSALPELPALPALPALLAVLPQLQAVAVAAAALLSYRNRPKLESK